MVHIVYCVAFYFSRGVDSFKLDLLETMVDLNLGYPKRGRKREVTKKTQHP
jgi:hypothetical protein